MEPATGDPTKNHVLLESQHLVQTYYSKQMDTPMQSTLQPLEWRSKLRKRAREEVTPVPTLYNEALVELTTQPDCSDVAPTLPTYTSFKSSMYRSRRKRLPLLPKTRA